MGKEFKVYTKTGDDGTSALVGGNRVKKYDIRLDAYGTVDELNASIGVLRAYDLTDDIINLLIQIQNKLFNIGSILASDEKGQSLTANLAITDENIKDLEIAIDSFEVKLPELTYFIIPGGELSVAHCHVARTVCRRAERRIVELSEQVNVQAEIIRYVNRLSDFLFVLARKIAFDKKLEEIAWKKD
jgi:cob(I)alamin adenosyltransferase